MKSWFSVLVLLVLGAGCAPYDKPVFVEWGSSTTPFLVQVEGDAKQATVLSEALLAKSMIGARRVQITYRWQDLGRGPNNGKFLPQERLILVDRDPVTREWTASKENGTTAKDQAIWVESKDSVNFSVGIAITARIVDNADAVKFLFNYPAGKEEAIKLDDSYKDDYVVKHVDLASVMDAEVRARIQKVFAEEAAKWEMDELRGKKNEIMQAIEKDCKEFFNTRGITITTIGMLDGLTYKNPQIQASIDAVFKAQMDKNVALAEVAAAKERKNALREMGEGEGQKKLAAAEQEAKAIQAIADAKAYELGKLNENPDAYIALKQLELQKQALDVWDGKYPVFLMAGDHGNTPNLLLTLPKVEIPQGLQRKPKDKAAAAPAPAKPEPASAVEKS